MPPFFPILFSPHSSSGFSAAAPKSQPASHRTLVWTNRLDTSALSVRFTRYNRHRQEQIVPHPHRRRREPMMTTTPTHQRIRAQQNTSPSRRNVSLLSVLATFRLYLLSEDIVIADLQQVNHRLMSDTIDPSLVHQIHIAISLSTEDDPIRAIIAKPTTLDFEIAIVILRSRCDLHLGMELVINHAH